MLTAFCLFATLLPVAARATDAHVVLYADGSLVFQNDDTPRDGKTVRQTYTVDLTEPGAPPWYDERQGVFVVDFAVSVRPASTRNWFSGFTNLEFVHNIQNLDTSADTDMSGMFDGCASLRELDLSGFDTSGVTDMSGMFRDSTRLTALNLSTFDTSLVTDMSAMFQRCTALTEVNLTNFATDSLESTASMFEDCPNLETVYASERFDASSVQSGDDMFAACAAIVGGNGTRFDSEHTDNAYARLDTADAPGYFSTRTVPSPAPVSDEVFAVLYNDGSFAFQRGDMSADGKEAVKTYLVDMAGGYENSYYVPWYREREDIRVVSFEDAIRPASTAFWFYGASNLERVEHIERLDTRDVTTMFSMFYGCSSLTELDVSGFQTFNVTQMLHMFEGCSGLTTLDLSGFNTRNVEEFYGMFHDCSSLRTIYVSDGFVIPADVFGPGMFLGYTSLVGGNGTAYDSAHTDETYARLDTADAPGYFSAGTAVTFSFTVTWNHEDGTTLQTDEVPSGTTPAYSGDAPVKDGHAFAGWTPEPAPVFADTTYTARFTPVEHPFDVGADAYSFGNTADDFGYRPGQYPISPNSAFLIFGDGMLGRVQYNRAAATPWSGNCAGMSASAALLYADENINAADFGRDNVWSIEIGDSHGDLTALRFIEAMQMAQYTEAFAEARHNHEFARGESLLPLAGAVRDAAGRSQPTLIAIVREGVGGHALLAFGVENETDAGAELQVYDCNHPGEVQRLTIRNTSEWSYDMGTYGVWGGEGCSISYVPFETLESIWTRAMHETLTVNVGNLSIADERNEEVATLVDGRLVTDRDDIYEMPELSMCWPEERTIFLPKGLYTITSEEDTELTATMTDQHLSASITTSASTVSFEVDDDTMRNTVTVVDASEMDTYSAALESDFDEMLYQNLVLEGTGQGETLEISMNLDGAPFFSNCGSASLTVDEVPRTTYNITASTGEGGTVTPAGNATIPAGTDRTFTFAPDAGYTVRSVSVDNVEIGPRSSYTFRNVAENHVLSVTFERLLSAVRDGGQLRVTPTNPDGQTVAVSYFDENGRFVSADLRPAAASVTFPLAAAHTARVMLLDASYKPLCAAVPVSLT